MKRLTLSLPLLAGVGLLCGAVGFGLGRLGKGTAAADAGDRAQGGATALPTLESPAVTGQSEAEKTARGEVRAFVPGRPFPKGGAEKWLSGLVIGERGMMDVGGILASLRQVGGLDTDSAKEVAATFLSIIERLEADEAGDETAAIWEDSGELLALGLTTSLGIVAEEDAEAALALLDSMAEPDRQVTAMVWAEIARQNPDRVEALLAGREEEALPLALHGAVHGLLASDSEGARALLAKYQGDDFREAWSDAVGNLVERDARSGVEFAADLVDAGGHVAPLVSGVSEWFEKDAAGARAWVENYQGPGQDAARATLLRHEARENPREAMEEYAALRARGLSNGELGEVAGEIAAGLVDEDAAAARAWVESLPEGRDQEAAVTGLVSDWVNEDATAASEWVAALPAGHARDSAADAIARAVAESDPAAAFAWAHSIGDEGMRAGLASQVLRDWIAVDPAAAYAAAAAEAAARAETE